MDKTLVAYASKSGATEQTAQIIAEVLKDKHGLEVDIVDLRKDNPSIEQYRNIVIGAGVRARRVYGEALKFLKQDFGDRKVAFFVCCGGAGDPKNYENSCKQYLTKVLANYPNIKPLAKEAFGGRMKIFGKTIFDNVDSTKIRAWANDLGNKLAK
jgi:menaquinone-dependent protoporphyrinogen IX oxidase